jgi:hypothetical protein
VHFNIGGEEAREPEGHVNIDSENAREPEGHVNIDGEKAREPDLELNIGGECLEPGAGLQERRWEWPAVSSA